MAKKTNSKIKRKVVNGKKMRKKNRASAIVNTNKININITNTGGSTRRKSSHRKKTTDLAGKNNGSMGGGGVWGYTPLQQSVQPPPMLERETDLVKKDTITGQIIRNPNYAHPRIQAPTSIKRSYTDPSPMQNMRRATEVHPTGGFSLYDNIDVPPQINSFENGIEGIDESGSSSIPDEEDIIIPSTPEPIGQSAKVQGPRIDPLRVHQTPNSRKAERDGNKDFVAVNQPYLTMSETRRTIKHNQDKKSKPVPEKAQGRQRGDRSKWNIIGDNDEPS